jgi:hypothetical protein
VRGRERWVRWQYPTLHGLTPWHYAGGDRTLCGQSWLWARMVEMVPTRPASGTVCRTCAKRLATFDALEAKAVPPPEANRL